MKKVRNLLFLTVWLICGVFGYGITLHDFICKYPYASSTVLSLVVGMTGPFGLMASIGEADTYGLTFKPLSVEQRWHAFQVNFPSGSREEFEETYNNKKQPCNCSPK